MNDVRALNSISARVAVVVGAFSSLVPSQQVSMQAYRELAGAYERQRAREARQQAHYRGPTTARMPRQRPGLSPAARLQARAAARRATGGAA